MLKNLGVWKKQADMLLEKSVKMREDSFEFLTSWRSTETNTETQPWCTLGYYPGFDAYFLHAFSGSTCNLCADLQKPNLSSAQKIKMHHQNINPPESSPQHQNIYLLLIPFLFIIFFLFKFRIFNIFSIPKKQN